MPKISDVGKVDAFVREFTALVEEGWEPDLKEFVSRIPEPLREEAFVEIDEALANIDVQEAPELLPQVEVEAQYAGPLARLVARAVPGDIRHHWLAEFAHSMRLARDCGLPPSEVFLLSAPRAMNGIAQHAPLQVGTSDPDNGLGRAAWWAWRAGGPAMLCGYVFGSGLMLAVGCAALLFALGMIAWFAREEPMPEPRARACNAVMGGCVAGLAILVLPGAITALTVMGSLALGQTWLAALAVHALTVLAVLSLCAITVSGWVPEPWQPKRLFRV